jgi:antitoxin PrlF
MEALKEAQAAFSGEAERAGLKDENDVVAMMKEFRQERTVK